MQVFNPAILAVATLSGNSDAASGHLQLTNKTGESMVTATVLQSGVGVVFAGPSAFQHKLMFTPFPGSYIQGR